MTIQEVMQIAAGHFMAGRLADAERVCRDILAQQPNTPGALHLLGVIAKQTGHNDAAIDLFRSAMKLSPQNAELHNNLGVSLKDQGKTQEAIVEFNEAIRLNPLGADAHNNLGTALTQQCGSSDQAVACFRRAIQLRPDFAEAFNNLGIALKNQEKPAEAVAALRESIRLRPNYARAYGNLGNALADQDKLDEAVAAYRHAIQLSPGYADAHYNLANVERRQEKLDEAIGNLRLAIQFKPDYPEAYNNLGIALNIQKKYDEAIAAYRQAIRRRPIYASAYHNLGNSLADQGRLDEAISVYRQAIALTPDLAEAYYSMGVALKDLGKLDEAEAACNKALELKPDYPSASWVLAAITLMRGDFVRGWQEAEWRLQCKQFPSPPRDWDQPRWAGEELNGRTILLHAEQGFGDTLQFIRYAPLVAARGGKVILECQPGVLRLLKTMPGVTEAIGTGSPLPKFDVHSPLLSLPLAFGTRLDSVPNQVPYITPDPKFVETWGRLMSGSSDEWKVGLAWAGSPSHQNDRNRTLSLKQLARLKTAPGVRFYSLQKGPAAAQAADNSAALQLIDLTAGFTDFAETAAMIAHLDLVITVDTVIAHLAGAMGKPVWVFLPYVPDWRWMLKRQDSPWYPTMRLFRQEVQGEWEGPIQRVAECLKMREGVSRSLSPRTRGRGLG